MSDAIRAGSRGFCTTPSSPNLPNASLRSADVHLQSRWPRHRRQAGPQQQPPARWVLNYPYLKRSAMLDLPSYRDGYGSI